MAVGAVAVSAVADGAIAIGAIAVGAVAVRGAMAIGAIAVGAVAVRGAAVGVGAVGAVAVGAVADDVVVCGAELEDVAGDGLVWKSRNQQLDWGAGQRSIGSSELTSFEGVMNRSPASTKPDSSEGIMAEVG